MADLTKEQVEALLQTMGYDVPEPDLTEVTYRINALMDGMRELDSLNVFDTEPWPVPPLSLRRKDNG